MVLAVGVLVPYGALYDVYDEAAKVAFADGIKAVAVHVDLSGPWFRVVLAFRALVERCICRWRCCGLTLQSFRDLFGSFGLAAGISHVRMSSTARRLQGSDRLDDFGFYLLRSLCYRLGAECDTLNGYYICLRCEVLRRLSVGFLVSTCHTLVRVDIRLCTN